MKEINAIINAWSNAEKNKQKAALATVVKVEGSSYRRAGARMLVTEDGILTGAISGGCLEGDALKKALSAIHQQQNKLVTYDTTDEDDAKFGVQLGCSGIVHILFEPIQSSQVHNPIALLKALQGKREDAVIATLFSVGGRNQPGTSMLYRFQDQQGNPGETLKDQVVADSEEVLATKNSIFKTYDYYGDQVEGFIEYLSPPVSLIIAGAGNDAQPLAWFAHQLGWQVTVADGRPTHATHQRFPWAEKVLLAKPPQLINELTIDRQTAFVLMTHNYNYDTELLGLLLKTDAPYIGTLGPKKKLIRMLDELGQHNSINSLRVHGPVGLDIGAETAEEIAISIIAEIKSVFSGATVLPLKEKAGPVHQHSKTPAV